MDRLASDLPYIDEDEVLHWSPPPTTTTPTDDIHPVVDAPGSGEPLPQPAYLTTVRIHDNINITNHGSQPPGASPSASSPKHNGKHIATEMTNFGGDDADYNRKHHAWRWSMPSPLSQASKHKFSKSSQHLNHAHMGQTRNWSVDEDDESFSEDVLPPHSNQPNHRPTATTATTSNEHRLGHRRVDEVTGVVTYKNIESSQIMGSIQLGITQSLNSVDKLPERDILLPDFNEQERVYLPAAGSPTTPAHKYGDFYFTTHMPIAFRYFRALFDIHPRNFVESMTSRPLEELSNPGASGSVFYRTFDDRFIIKTVTKYEANFLHTLLPGYFMNYQQNPQSMLPRFLGLYYYECGGDIIRLLVMNNLLPSTITLHQKYDLKGSTLKREASSQENKKAQPTYKDLDFIKHYHLDLTEVKKLGERAKGTKEDKEDKEDKKDKEDKEDNDTTKVEGKPKYKTWDGRRRPRQRFGLGPGINLEKMTYEEVLMTLDKDCLVLESFGIMDFSLLMGVHNYDDEQRRRPKGTKPTFDFDDDSQLPPGAIRAINGSGERLLLFLGIIDILQSYRFIKRMEHFCKSLIYDSNTISVIKPKLYARRFISFIAYKVFCKMPPDAQVKLKTTSLTRISHVGEREEKEKENRFGRTISPQRVSILLGRPV